MRSGSEHADAITTQANPKHVGGGGDSVSNSNFPNGAAGSAMDTVIASGKAGDSIIWLESSITSPL